MVLCAWTSHQSRVDYRPAALIRVMGSHRSCVRRRAVERDVEVVARPRLTLAGTISLVRCPVIGPHTGLVKCDTAQPTPCAMDSGRKAQQCLRVHQATDRSLENLRRAQRRTSRLRWRQRIKETENGLTTSNAEDISLGNDCDAVQNHPDPENADRGHYEDTHPALVGLHAIDASGNPDGDRD